LKHLINKESLAGKMKRWKKRRDALGYDGCFIGRRQSLSKSATVASMNEMLPTVSRAVLRLQHEAFSREAKE
jgi:hypothetical protein